MLALGAEIEFHPVMVLEDLGKASAQLERVAQKYCQDAACLDATGPGSRGALALLHDLIHRSAWKGDSPKFAKVRAIVAASILVAERDQRVPRKSSTRRVRSAAASASYDGSELSAK
jgi:hypothetical protein